MPVDLERDERLRGALATIAIVTTLGLLVAIFFARIFYKQWHISRGFEFDKLAIIAMSAALLALALARRRLGARTMLLGVAGLVAASLGLLGCLLASVDVAGRLKALTSAIVYRAHTAAIFDHDDRYGYVLRPNARDRERAFDYDVTYTIDATGRRVTPSPKSPRATILLAGDSFTFGIGVEDQETYPYLLGAEYWPDVKVVNAGVSGWGVAQAYLTIGDALARKPLPDAIVYAMIPDDQFRSHLREPITPGVARRLELVDGALQMTPAVERAAPTITPELVERELEMNRVLLAQMNRACADRGVPFALLLLQDEGRYPPDLIYGLAHEGIPIVDLTRIRYDRFPHDYHPNVADHRRIAKAVSASRIAAMIGRGE
jgi:hypothetical protein